MENISDATLRQLPQYIFRVTHDKSAGINTSGHYKSRALQHWGDNGRVDFFSLSSEEQAQQVSDHTFQRAFNSHWISLTDSPSTVIGRALLHDKTGKDIRLHIIDTIKVRKPALIVWSYAMLRGYRICVNLDSVQKKVLGSAYAGFLVWDELIVDAAVVKLEDVLKPPDVHPNLYTPGLQDLVPKLWCPATTRKGKRCRPAFRLRNLLYGMEQRIETILKRHRPFGPVSNYRQLDWADWRGPPKHLQRQDAIDPRCGFDYLHRSRVERLVDKFPNDIKMVMLAFFLSMKTNDHYEESIVDEVASFAIENPSKGSSICYTKKLATAKKPDVVTFQRILVDGFEKSHNGKVAKRGMIDVQRNVIRLDSQEVMKPETPYQRFLRCDKERKTAKRARPCTLDEDSEKQARKKTCFEKADELSINGTHMKHL